MAAGTAELLVPDGDGDEERGIAEAEMYATVPGVANYPAEPDPLDTADGETYVHDGLMRLQDYLHGKVSATAIYGHIDALRGSHASVLDQERTPAQRAKSLPIGRTATHAAYAGPPDHFKKSPRFPGAEQHYGTGADNLA